VRVLVTNARRRKAIPIVRSLAKEGMHVVCADSIRSATGFFSRYCHERLIYPELQSSEFPGFIIEWLSQNHCDVVFPLDDDVLECLALHRSRLPHPDALLSPDIGTIQHVNDKSWLIPYAASVGVPVPMTQVVRSEADLLRLDEVAFPAIVKPSHGSGGRGLCRAHSWAQLRAACREVLAGGHSVLIQESIPIDGHGLGYFALYNRAGDLVAQFMHKRLREYPVDGGPSTLREAVWNEPLAKIARGLLESLNWVGVAMVEFKEDVRDGVPKLMEINPRFWGSIALPIYSGVNFPVLAARTAAGLDVQPVLSYELGKKARWLWPGDILHFLASLRRGRWTKHFFNLFDPNTCDDMLSLKDPLPSIIFTFECLKKVANRE
jgi:predicted ATP-grasp superfamily ATP-dependent carboligase